MLSIFKALGFDEVIDTSLEKLGDGVRRVTDGCGADIIIDGIGGEVLSEAVKAFALGGSLITLGYSASRKTTIDVTDLLCTSQHAGSQYVPSAADSPYQCVELYCLSTLNPVRSSRSWLRPFLWQKRRMLFVTS